MRRPTLGLVVAAAVAVAACQFGPRVGTYVPARTALGIRVRINNTLTSELLVVSDSALLVRGQFNNRITLVRYTRLRDARFPQDASLAFGPFRDGRQPPADLRARWRLVARYPQGLTPEQLAELLRARSQAAVESL